MNRNGGVLKQKKVAVALNMLAPYWHDVYERLSKEWEIVVFVADFNEPNREYRVPDFSTMCFAVKKSRNIRIDLSRLGWKTSYLHFQWGLWANLREYKPDVILSNELGPRTLLAMLYGYMYSVPVVPWVCASKHTERNNSRARELIRRLLVRNAPSVCTNLTEAKEYLTDVLAVAESKLFPTPYAVDVKKIREGVSASRNEGKRLREELSLKKRVFLYVGQMIPRKGLMPFFRAITCYSRQLEEASFLLIGGNLDMDVVSLLDHHGIHWQNVPFVQPELLYKYYAAADIFFLPSLEDEWGIVLNEALASGLPVLASKYAAATRDLVQDERNGKVFDPLSIESTRESVLRILSLDDTELKRWGQASQEIVASVDIGFTVSNMSAALKRALGENTTPS